MLEVVLHVFILRSNPLAFLLLPLLLRFSSLLLLLRVILLKSLLLLRLFLLFLLFTAGYRPLLVSQLLPLGLLPIMLPLAVLLIGHVGRLRLLLSSWMLSLVLLLAFW